ncbi:MAG: hypothetical protein R2827_08055 [Bdellovibrionales bacterium]
MKRWIQFGLLSLFLFFIAELVMFAPESMYQGSGTFNAVTEEAEEIQQAMVGIHLIETLEGAKNGSYGLKKL